MKKVIISLGNGDLRGGLSNVTVEIWREGAGKVMMRSIVSLPPAPELAELQRQWQHNYQAFYQDERRCLEIADEEIASFSAPQFQEVCEQLPTQLNDWLNCESFLAINQKLRAHLDLNEEISLIIACQDHQIRRLPWHQWHLLEDYQRAEIAFAPLDFAQPRQSVSTSPSPQVRILAIIGHCQGIETQAECKILQDLPHTEVKFLVEPSRQELNRQLRANSWDLLFFAGHSETQGTKGCIYLNPNESLSLGELKHGLSKAIERGLKLAMFNSCDGLGLAEELEQLNIPQIIVMREPVPDIVAQEFFLQFVISFATGESFYHSVREARESLQGLENQFPCATWLPVICQNPSVAPPRWKDLYQNSLGTSFLHQPWRVNLVLVFLMSLISTFTLLGLRWFGKLQPLELWAYDRLTQLKPREEQRQDPRLLVITIDNQDLEYQDEQGMARKGSLADSALAQLLDELAKLNPRVIGSDIYHPHPLSANLVSRLQKLDYPFYIVCKARYQEQGQAPPPRSDIPAEYWGFSDVVTDADGVVRRHLLTMRSQGSDPCSTDVSFSLSIAQHYLDLVFGGIEVENTTKDFKIGNHVWHKLTDHSSGYQGEDTAGSQILLNYRSYSSEHNIAESMPLRDILERGIPPHRVEDFQKYIVIIGVTARGENHDDFFKTPYGDEIPGVFLQAQMISQLISAVLDKRPLIHYWSFWGEYLWIWGWSLVGGTLALFIRVPGLIQLTLFFTLGGLFGVSYFLFIQAIWVPLIPPALGLVASTELLMWMLVIVPSRRSKNKYLSQKES